MEEFSRIQRLPPYVFNITAELKISARRRGEDIIDFGMGNPDGATPKHIVDKLVEAALKPPTHRYSVSRGIPRLRRAICTWYKTRYNVDLDPETETIVTIGSKEGLAHLMLATLDRGDTVLVPNPSYPIHIYGPVIAGAHVISVPVHDQQKFLAQLEDLIPRMVPRPKALIVNFPSNPTTECVELPFLARLVELAREYGFHLIQDLAYADIAFDGYRPPSILEVPGAKEVAVELTDVLDQAKGKGIVTRGCYDLQGMRADADYMLWWVAPTSDELQEMYVNFRRTKLGRASEPVWSAMALHRPAEFNKSHIPAFLAEEEPKNYVCVYPFVRDYEWYLLDEGERRRMLAEHGMMAREYPDVRANTVSSFALNDYEWMLAFEADELYRIVDLMRHLRGADARRHTRVEIPFYTGRRKPVAELVAALV